WCRLCRVRRDLAGRHAARVPGAGRGRASHPVAHAVPDGERARSAVESEPMAEAEQSLDALRGWRARLDLGIKAVGVIVAHAGLAAQVAGFSLAFLSSDP